MTAVTTYATLQTRVGEDCNRTDAAFTAALPGFIQSAEVEMSRRLRVRQMITRASATINAEYELLPTGFMGVRSFELDTTPPLALRYCDPDTLTALKATYQGAGKPLYYTILGEEFQFLPEPGEAYTGSLSYWRSIPALSVSNTTNWLLTAHPDAYIEGAKYHAFRWLQDEERAALSVQAFITILDDIQRDDMTQSYGASLQARPTVAV